MKPFHPASLALLCGALFTTTASLQAGPRFASGDVTFQGTLSVTDSSRVSPNAFSSGDTIYSFTPSVNYSRESNRMNLNASLSAPMRRYDSNDALDSNNIQFSLSGEVPFGANPRLSGSWNVNYHQGIQSSFLTNQNLDTTSTNLSINTNYRLRNKLSIRATASSQQRSNSGINSNFVNDNETDSYSIGLQGHNLVGSIGGYVTYQVQNRKTTLGQIDQSVDNKDDGLNFGITGQILPERLFPKLDADLSFSFASTEGSDRNYSQSGGRNNRLTFNGSLRYPANPKTDIALTMRRSLGVTDDDRTVEQTNFNLSTTYSPRPKLGFTASVGVTSSDFIYDDTERSDDAFTTSLSARYSIRRNWSCSLGYNLRNSSSNVQISDYSSSQLTLSTTLTY